MQFECKSKVLHWSGFQSARPTSKKLESCECDLQNLHYFVRAFCFRASSVLMALGLVIELFFCSPSSHSLMEHWDFNERFSSLGRVKNKTKTKTMGHLKLFARAPKRIWINWLRVKEEKRSSTNSNFPPRWDFQMCMPLVADLLKAPNEPDENSC